MELAKLMGLPFKPFNGAFLKLMSLKTTFWIAVASARSVSIAGSNDAPLYIVV